MFTRSTRSLYSPRWVNRKPLNEQDEETIQLEEDKPPDSNRPPSDSGSHSPAVPPDSSDNPESPPPPSQKSTSSSSIAKQSVPEVYPQVLALPIARRPLFPGFYKAVVIRNPHVVAAVKEMMKRGQPYLGAFLLKDENIDSDVITDIKSVHPVGVFAQITSVFAATSSGEDKEEGLTAVLYPHRRIKITDLVKAGAAGKVQQSPEEKVPQTVEPTEHVLEGASSSLLSSTTLSLSIL
jgi:ATP-dependent Lon protease